MNDTTQMTGYAKIAYLTRLLGKDVMVKYTNELDRETVEKIQAAIPDTAVLKTDADQLLEEFDFLMKSVINDIAVAGLTDAWDDNQSDSMISIPPDLTGLQKLAKFDIEKLHDFIKEEDILNQVVILNHLPIELAKGVFQKLSVNDKASFTVSAATAKDISDEQLKYIDHTIEDRLERGTAKTEKPIDKVLPFTDTVDEDELNKLLSLIPSDLATEIKNNTITFSNVSEQSEETLGLIFDQLSSDVVAQALCTLSDDFKSKVLSTCTNNRIKDIEYSIKSSARPDDADAVKTAHREVVATAKKLQSNGDIVINR